MGEDILGLRNPFVLEESHLLGPHSIGLVQAPTWLMTLMPTAMAQVAMSPMGMNPGGHLSGAHIAPPRETARIQPCWRPLRAARGVYVCVMQGLEVMV
jgi:hypothetical protein